MTMHCLDNVFEKIGKVLVKYPWVFIICSLVLTGGLGAGSVLLVTENRAEKQWVPAGSASLVHQVYVEENYPSTLRFGSFIATCKGENCNILESKYLKRMDELIEKIENITIDGDKVRVKLELEKTNDTEWKEMYSGKWTYEGDEDNDIRQKCFLAGPVCLGSSVLGMFGDSVDTVTDGDVLRTITSYDSAEVFCPLSLSRADSPCYNATVYNSSAGQKDCLIANPSTEQRLRCADSMENYCKAVQDVACPRSNFLINNLKDLTNENPTVPSVNQPIERLMSSGKDGPIRNPDGSIQSAKALRASLFLAETPIFVDGSMIDPISEEWEKMALCALGQIAESGDTDISVEKCKKDDLMDIYPFFSRSLGDLFGNEVRGDAINISVSFGIVAIYLIVMLSRRDSVHSMIAMGGVTAAIIGMAFFGCKGFGGLVGVFDNQLTLNIPLLLLGLGVDDAFVIVAEYERYFMLNPKATPEERVIAATRGAGVSILITSVTDALAFLIGSSTVLPALSWFCIFAGAGVILCFIFQITVFLPALYLNAKRADANRYDCCCCCGPKEERSFHEPKGCCYCCNCEADMLERAFTKFGKTITRGPARIASLVMFAAILGVGIWGATEIYKDFKIEWFLPADSYPREFIDLNNEFFQAGVNFDVYTQEMNYSQNQPGMMAVHEVLVKSDRVDQVEGVSDWHHAFLENIKENKPEVVSDGMFEGSADSYYLHLLQFFQGTAGWGIGASLRNNVNWVDPKCDTVKIGEECDYKAGIRTSKIGAVLNLNATATGLGRYETLDTLRTELAEAMKFLPEEKQPFPYSSDFLNWEEVGIIDTELIRNLAVAGSVILVIIAIMIPSPRIAVWVVFCIVVTIIDLIGYLHWWDVTINSTSTIYILISAGLAVDYAAHIAHMFVVSTGPSEERVVMAMTRIGPSVFNGVFSTLLAVIVLAFTKTYVFQVFAKSLALTVILGGAHGLWLLPCLLSVFGGSRETPTAPDVDVKLSEVKRQSKSTSANGATNGATNGNETHHDTANGNGVANGTHTDAATENGNGTIETSTEKDTTANPAVAAAAAAADGADASP